jgi:hypothetical protein
VRVVPFHEDTSKTGPRCQPHGAVLTVPVPDGRRGNGARARPRTVAARVAVLATAASCLLTHGAQAQENLVVERGARVRITGPAQRHVGTFEALRADTLVLVDDSVQSIPLHTIDRFEVSRGRRPKTWTGAQVGFLAGAAAGAAVGAVASSCSGSECAPLSTGGWIAAGALVAGAAGGVIGAIVGATTHSDIWEEVPLDRLRDVLRVTDHEPTEAGREPNPPHSRRHGMWGGVGVGAAMDSRVAGPAVQVRVGGTSSPHLLLGGDVTASGARNDGLQQLQATAGATALVYPSADGNLFVAGGMGAVVRGTEYWAGTDTSVGWHAGFAAHLGVGYDVPLGTSVAFTPNLAMLYQTASSGVAFLLTVGLTWH